MAEFVMEIAGAVFYVQPLYESTRDYCREYWSCREPELLVCLTQDDLLHEQRLLDLEADEEGLKRRKFGGPFLERSVIQRRIAEELLTRETIMMHGSTVAVDGQAYLFTAPCGTGKSTHTRLWREVFGERAVMVNDDKPFLKLTGDGVLAYGSPWTGKHGLGSNVRFPLKGICILKRGNENRIRRIGPEEARAMLRHQSFQPAETPDSVLPLVERLMELVPLWQMECTKEHAAAEVAYKSMKMGE